MDKIDFTGRVAIVTGAGGGLGRLHALALAARGAKVVVNDLGGAVDGSGGSASAAQKVVDEIKAAGGEAMANGASVTDFDAVQAMVQQAIDAYADAIHPWRDGRASERVLAATEALLAGELGTLRRKPLAGWWRGLQLRRELGYWGR